MVENHQECTPILRRGPARAPEGLLWNHPLWTALGSLLYLSNGTIKGAQGRVELSERWRCRVSHTGKFPPPANRQKPRLADRVTLLFEMQSSFGWSRDLLPKWPIVAPSENAFQANDVWGLHWNL